MNRKTRFVMGLVVAVALVVTLVPAIVQAEEEDDYYGYYGGGGWCHSGTYGAALSDRTTLNKVAKVLDLTLAKLNARLRAGDTVAEIAEEKGVDLQTVVDTALARHKDLLQRRVESEYIAQSQSDAILRLMEEETTAAFEDGYGVGYGFGGYGMGTGMMGGWGHMGGMMGSFGGGRWGW